MRLSAAASLALMLVPFALVPSHVWAQEGFPPGLPGPDAPLPGPALERPLVPDEELAKEIEKAVESGHINIQLSDDTARHAGVPAILHALPPDVRARLNGTEIERIVLASKKTSVLDAVEDIVVPVVVVGGFFFLVGWLTFMVLRARQRRERELYDTLHMFLEKDLPIPPELFHFTQPKRNDRRTGVMLCMTGLGIGGFLLADGGSDWGLGLVPLLIGAGYLLSWHLERRDAEAVR